MPEKGDVIAEEIGVKNGLEKASYSAWEKYNPKAQSQQVLRSTNQHYRWPTPFLPAQNPGMKFVGCSTKQVMSNLAVR